MAVIPVWVSSEIVPIRLLCEISSDEVAYAGSKGAHLGQLTRTGLPVPPAFVVGAPAYKAFRVQTGLDRRLQTLMSGLDVEDAAAVQQVTEGARRAIQESDMPDWIEDAIATAYRCVVGDEADGAVVVRSSGVAKDPSLAWFAGLNQAFLGVQGVGAVVNRVKRSWMSLFRAETIRYRAERGLRTSDLDIAVIVQRQIPATAAGIIFTTDPATDARDQLVIEAYSEFGSALANRNPGFRRRDCHVVDKRLMTVLRRGEHHRPIVTDDEVFRLAELGVAIEREYRSPQVIEWVFDPEGLIWLLQSRPLPERAQRAVPA
jgi:phosphoenolpyruvate synthase/pyruvate phosphate dikinase